MAEDGGGWWDLPGPAAFLDRAAGGVHGPGGVLGLALPRPPPAGWLGAVLRRIDAQASSMPIAADASAGLRGRSPVRLLAAAAGLETAGLRLTAQFLAEASLADAVRSGRAGGGEAGGPTIVLDVPPSIPPDDVRAALGALPLRWMGVMSRLDTRLFTERLGGRQEGGLAARVAAETVVELAGWDRTAAEALSGLSLQERLDPTPHLAVLAAGHGGVTPCWENGLVDTWDGHPHVSSLALAAAGDVAALAARLWSARVRVVFPFLNTVRLAFAHKYEAPLRAALPITKAYNTRQQVYDDPYGLELFDIGGILGLALPPAERRLLDDCLRLRRAMAHADPGQAASIVRASELWERLEPDFPAATAGWDWPRCGQSVVVLAGPQDGGWTGHAGGRYDRGEIVSHGAIRAALSRPGAEAAPAVVAARVRAEVRARLAAGRHVVVDAAPAGEAGLLAAARLVPADIPVEYADAGLADGDGRAAAEGGAGAAEASLDGIMPAAGLAGVVIGNPPFGVQAGAAAPAGGGRGAARPAA
jgi:hypothetical protein